MILQKKLFFLSILLFSTILFISCGGDDDVSCNEASYAQDLSNESQQLSEAASAYVVDPDNSNLCNNYLTALENYLDGIERYRGCAAELGQLNEFNQSLADARTSLNDLTCP